MDPGHSDLILGMFRETHYVMLGDSAMNFKTSMAHQKNNTLGKNTGWGSTNVLIMSSEILCGDIGCITGKFNSDGFLEIKKSRNYVHVFHA